MPNPEPVRSLWLQEVLVDAVDQDPLRGVQHADVAIVGGGYVGLWTALRLKEADPGCDVALLEADICGAGASGRNGGQLHAYWERLASLVARFGADDALWLARQSAAAIDEIGALQTEHGKDIGFRRGGWIWTATTEAQRGAWLPALDAIRAHGVPDALRELDGDELLARTGSPVHLAGVVEDAAGTVHPAKLVRALRELALAAGVRIFEHSPARLERSSPPRLHTPEGRLTAGKVVIATNAWAARIPELRSQIFVVGSNIVATEPIPEQLAQLGLDAGAAICDSQRRVTYYQASASGRLMFGRGGGRVAALGRVGRAFDADPRWQADAERELRRIQPALAGARITHGWGGPVDVTLSGLPLLGRLGGRDDLLIGVGWSGTGIGPAVLGGRVLAALALGIEDEYSTCALVDRPVQGRYPPEPLRSVGAVIVRGAVSRTSAALAGGRKPKRADVALARLDPGRR